MNPRQTIEASTEHVLVVRPDGYDAVDVELVCPACEVGCNCGLRYEIDMTGIGDVLFGYYDWQDQPVNYLNDVGRAIARIAEGLDIFANESRSTFALRIGYEIRWWVDYYGESDMDLSVWVAA